MRYSDSTNLASSNPRPKSHHYKKMASTTATKRAWKLQEFVAHGSSVNCLALGRKSGRVLVTGGEDKKVNLWAVGKPNCIMSLTGHTTPVECVRFSYSDEFVCAGSLSGALKIWDLEAAKILRTLTGHKANIKSLDFHPYGDFLASGSSDTNIKLWDIKRKGCIFTYKGHTSTVNSIKFSPDGRWIASAGEDGAVKIWDLPAGKMLAEFRSHIGAVRDVEFHPNEFLLASGSVDRTVKYWDLESFQLVSSTDGDSGPISCIYFSPDGECLFSGGQDLLKVYGWEPARVFDSVVMSWGKVADIATAQNQLIGASFVQTNVSIYIVDLKRINPFGGITSTPSAFQSGSHVRKSFNRQKPINHGSKSNNISSSVQMKTEDSETITPEIDPGDDSTSVADIKDIDDYKAIFHPRRRELVRTPPPPGRVDPFPAPPEDNSQRSEAVTPPEIIVRPEPVKPEPIRPKTEPIIRPEPKRSDRVSPRTSPRAEPRTIISSRTTSPRSENARFEPSRAELACADSTLSEPVHTQSMLSRIETVVTETVTQKSESRPPIVANTSAVSSSSCEPVVRNVTPSVVVTRKGENQNIVSIKTDVHSNKMERADILDYIPTQRDRPVGLDLDDFLPCSLKTFHDTMRIGQQAQPEISEAEAISSIIKGHESMLAVLTNRHRHIQIVLTMWSNKDIKAAIESAVHMGDQAVMVDILNVIVLKPSLWSLDLSVILLPSIYDLVQSKYEIYMLAGCQALRIVLKNFASVIKTNITAPPSIGIDLQREERYNKCMSCYNQLVSIRAFILKRQTLQGKLGQTFRELHILLQVLD